MSSCDSNACVVTPPPLVNDVLNNALFHSSPRINQTLHQILHVVHFCPLDSLLNYAAEFVVNWIEVTAVRPPQIWKFVGVTTIYEIIALSECRQRMMHSLFGKHRRKKDHSQKNQNRYYVILTYIIKSLQ